MGLADDPGIVSSSGRLRWGWAHDVLVAVLAAPVAVRLAGAEAGWPLVPLLLVVPYLAPALSLLAALAALAGRRAATAVAVAALVAVVAVISPRGLIGPAPAGAVDGPTVTVMATNLRTGHADLDEVVSLVRRHEVDVLAVVELTRRAAEGLREAGLPLDFVHDESRPGPVGAGLWSRWALTPERTLAVSSTVTMPRARIEVPGAGPIEVTAVHPPPPVDAAAVATWERGLALLPPAGADVLRILAGDFNATLDHGALRRVLAGGYVDAADAVGRGLTWTWNGLPYGHLALPAALDHVLVDRRIAVEHVDIAPLVGSDHRVVIARVRLPRAGSVPAA